MTKPATSSSRVANPRTKRPRRMARPPEAPQTANADDIATEADDVFAGVGTMTAGAACDPVTGEGGAARATAEAGIMDAPGAADARGTLDTTLPPSAEDAPQTKAALVLGLLRRSEGATLAELTAATGWQPHTVRAHLTGLRKKGNAIAKAQRGDATCYHIAEAV